METSVRQLFVTDTKASQFTAQVFPGGLLSAFGHSPTIAIRDFAAEAELNLEDIEKSSLKVTIQAAALTVKGDISVREGHDIAHDVKRAIRASDPRIVDVLVHIEPA